MPICEYAKYPLDLKGNYVRILFEGEDLLESKHIKRLIKCLRLLIFYLEEDEAATDPDAGLELRPEIKEQLLESSERFRTQWSDGGKSADVFPL